MEKNDKLAVYQLVVCCLLCLLNGGVRAQQINGVAFDLLPQDYQLYPRNEQFEARIPIAGRMAEVGWQYVSVQLSRNKQPIGYGRAAVNYTGGVGRFSVLPLTIRAEKAEYDVSVYLVKGTDSVNVVNRTNIVAGDVYVLTGQSNASAFFRDTRTNEFCRTFGKTSGTYGTEVYNPADTAWALSNQTKLTQNVGTMGFEFQQLMLEKYNLPTCLINAAFHWSMAAHHANRTPENPADLTNGYGRMIYRLQKGGLDKAVKALIYRQGESEAYGEGNNWGTYFDTFYGNLKLDLPSIKKLYVFQIDIIEPAVAAAPLVREAQRALAGKYTDVQVVTSVGTDGFDGLHYSEEGYKQNAREFTRLIARDFYGSTDTDNIDAPNIRRAYYSNTDRTEITLQFADGQDLTWTDQFGNLLLKNFIYLNGNAGDVTAGRAVGNKVFLTLKGPSTATKLTYLPAKYDPGQPDFPYRGPYITNKRGLRVLAFYNVPIADPVDAPTSTLKAPVLTVTTTSERSVAIAWTAVANATTYLLERKTGDMAYEMLGRFGPDIVSVSDTSLAPGTTYTYRLTTTGKQAESVMVSTLATTPTLLSMPALTLTIIYNSKLRIAWRDVPGAMTYILDRKAPDQSYQRVGSYGPSVLTVNDTSLAPGAGYTYRIRALGTLSSSPFASASIQTPALLSSPDLSLTVVYNNALLVGWKAISNATGYLLERKTGTQNFEPVGTFGPAVLAVTDTSLVPGTSYFYRIKAMSEVTESLASSVSAATPALLATPDLAVLPVSFNRLGLSWKAVPGALYYTLERKLPNAATYLRPVRLDANQIEYTDNQLIPSTPYQYRLIAYGNKTQSNEALSVATTLVLLATEPTLLVPFGLWPNPAQGGQTSLRFSAPTTGTVQVTDLRGVVQQQHSVVNQTEFPLSVGTFSPGIYLIRVGHSVQKLVVM